MKTIFIFCVMLMSITIGCKSTDAKINVPDAVNAKFSAMYPQAKGAEWKMEEGKHVVSFRQDGKKLKIVLTEDGSIVSFGEIIDPKELPESIKTYVTTQLEGKKITVANIYTDTKGSHSYEIEVDHRHYLFAKDGQFVGKRNGE